MADDLQEMIDAAKWQIMRACEDDDARLLQDLRKQPIDEIMAMQLVMSLTRRQEEMRSPKGRGRPSKDRRDFCIRYWVKALQEQCDLNESQAHKAIGDAICLSPDAIRSIAKSGK